jgi:hypothetical protein
LEPRAIDLADALAQTTIRREPRALAAQTTRRILQASIAGDLIIAPIKVGAAMMTGSSAMWSEPFIRSS